MGRPRLTGIVIQARMGSTRLPGKVLKDLSGRPMLSHIIERLKAVRNSDVLIVATSTNKADNAVEEFCSREGVDCFRGDEGDVLDRYYKTALHFKLDHIVRATADNPLVDPVEVSRLIDLHHKENADYTHSFGKLPIGVGAECFSFGSLERSWRDGVKPNHREHVNEYIQERPEAFRIEELDIPVEKRAPNLRLTVDTPEDFKRAEMIYEKLSRAGELITTEDAIRLCAMLFR
ncbi:MAG: glycosyltransferase family protein [Deltaproteobacteria bacterium]|nr:glycosyltransferase family protein [Deltaproteobacteria bacterium]